MIFIKDGDAFLQNDFGEFAFGVLVELLDTPAIINFDAFFFGFGNFVFSGGHE